MSSGIIPAEAINDAFSPQIEKAQGPMLSELLAVRSRALDAAEAGATGPMIVEIIGDSTLDAATRDVLIITFRKKIAIFTVGGALVGGGVGAAAGVGLATAAAVGFATAGPIGAVIGAVIGAGAGLIAAVV
ncbi:MAG: hypothetical protein LBF26_03100 [Puniceicoccales bacterium]|jgi:hypothetical protein|nr:hypothetical protein [Puniceicoccales bacterium]